MTRLSTRLVLSHLLVAVVGGLTAYLLTRGLVPGIYDRRARMPGRRARVLVLESINSALLIGVLAGVTVAALAGVWTARRLMQPLHAVQEATHRLAAGDYAHQVQLPPVHELAAVAADVNALAHRLADTERRRLHLLGEVAHEMRTPLTVLEGQVEGLIDGVFTPDAETLAQLTTELRRLRRLADDLAQLSRAEEQGVHLEIAPVDVGIVAQAATTRLRSQYQDAGVALHAAASEGLVVPGDADRLAQVITNLLGNALRATPAGGSVAVTGDRVGDEVVVAVTDTGVGLDPADQERIFERFYRVAAGDGTGIGLTIARAIVAAHGGSITATSPGPGRGTTVTMRLPAR